MKNKKFLRIIALVCVLVLCVSVLVACKKDKPKPDDGTQTTPPNPTGDAMNKFVDTMFQSANEIGKGVTLDVSEGKDIAISLGATLTLKNRKSSSDKGEMPIDVSIKGFIDRTNITKNEDGTVTVNDNNETYLDASVRINGIDSFRIIYEKDFLYATIAGNKVKISLNAIANTASGQNVKDTIFTTIENLLKKEIVQSVVKAFNGENFDLNKIITGLINTFVEKEYMPYDKSLYNATNRTRYEKAGNEYKENPNGGWVVKTLADTIFANDKSLGIGKLTLGGLISDIFGGKDNVYKYLGETLDLQGILKTDVGGAPLATSLFSAPSWEITTKDGKKIPCSLPWDKMNDYNAQKSYVDSFKRRIAGNLNQKLTASVSLDPIGLANSLGIALLKNGSIKLGFDKEAGVGDSIGKMSRFFLDINLPAGKGQKFGLELSINDLKIGNSKEAIQTTVVNEDEYGAFNFDAGLDFDFGKNLLDLIVHDYTDPNGWTIKVGGDDLAVDEKNKTITVPETLKLNIKGTLDLVNIENTKAVATITANEKTVAKIQLYAVENIATDATTPKYDLQLDAKIMDEYKNIVPAILDLCVYMGKNGGIGTWGFQQNEKGNWGFYNRHDEYRASETGIYKKGKYEQIAEEELETFTGVKFKFENGVATVDKAGTFKFVEGEGNYYPILSDEGFTGAKYEKYYSYTTKDYDHKYFVEAEDGPYGVKIEKLKKVYYKLSAKDLKTYKGKRYNRYVVKYNYEKLNNALDHFIKTGEAHVTGLNFVNIINSFIGGNRRNIHLNFEKPATASADGKITINDVIMDLVLNGEKGIVPAVNSIINFNNYAGLDKSLVIGGDKLLSTLFDNLFNFKTERTIDAIGMIALAQKYFTKYQVAPGGKTYDYVSVYKEFETELYKMTSRGIYANGLSKQLMLARPSDYKTAGETFFEENPDATTEAMKKYGYAVVKDKAGNKYLYPYVLMEELSEKKNDKDYLLKEGFELNNETKELVLVNTPAKLIQDIETKLNDPTSGTTSGNYLDVAGAELRQAYRLGKVYVPYFDGTEWKVDDKTGVLPSANAEIINDIGLRVIIGTKRDANDNSRVEKSMLKIEAKVYGKTVAITGYLNFEKTAPTIEKDENLLKDENTKTNAFNITILKPEDGTLANDN